MSHLQIFENERFGRVRTIEQNGEPWFIARDVCECLSIGKYRDAVSRLEEDERGSVEMDTPGGRQRKGIAADRDRQAKSYIC